MQIDAGILAQLDTALDTEIVAAYLTEVAKRSFKSFRQNKMCIEMFYRITGKSVRDLDFDDMDAVIDSIDAMDVTHGTKVTYWRRINSYFSHAKYVINRSGGNVKDLVPPKVAFVKGLKYNVDDATVLSEEKINEIIRLSRYNKRHHVIMLLATYTGARIGEILSTRVENVHVEERYLVTGLVNGNNKNNKALVFFFPRHVAAELLDYMLMLDDDEEWLFPSRSSRGYQVSFESLGKRYGVHFHDFRRTLITRRLDAGCPPHVSEMLVNHASSTVEFKHYWKKSLEERRRLYDAWTPVSF